MSAKYFKLIWRSLLRERQFSVLNLIGLSIGLACALLIWLWVNNERRIDHFNKHDERLYQVIKTSVNADGTIDTHETTPALMAQSMVAELPEIEYAVPVVIEREKGIAGTAEKQVKAAARFAGKDFFRIFSYEIVDGNSNSLLSDPMGVILSDQLALKLFNTTKELTGKTIYWNGEADISGPYHVTGVFKSPPADATDQFDILFSFDHYYATFWKKYGLDVWYSNNPSTYLLLREGTNVAAFNNKFIDDDFAKLYSSERRVAVLSKYFAGLAIIISCLGLFGLSAFTAQKRQKEIGIRKVIGAAAYDIAFMLSKNFLKLVLIALAIALPVAWWLMNSWLNEFQYRIEISADIFALAVLATIIVTIATISFQSVRAALANPVKSLRTE